MKKQQDFAALQRQTRARKRARNIVVYALLTLWGTLEKPAISPLTYT